MERLKGIGRDTMMMYRGEGIINKKRKFKSRNEVYCQN